ncbi:MAG: invasin domain 3-containing protein [Synechococcus sp.]|nr:invasin domain 3-containing protein [Synechococcus sp.]
MNKRFSIPLTTLILALGGWFSEAAAQSPQLQRAEINGVLIAPPGTTAPHTAFQASLRKTDDQGGIQGEIYLAQLPENVVPEPEATPELPSTITEEVTAPSPTLNDPADPAAIAQPTVQFISPGPGNVLEKNSSAVVIEVPTGSTTTLRVNGAAVDPNQIGQLETNGSTGRVRQTWYGVIFGPGENTLEATATLNGTTVSNAIQVQAPGDVAKLRLSTVETRVPADGRSPVTIQGTLLDENGNRASGGGRITLEATAGEFLGEDAGPEAPGFQVDAKDGEFTATLQSSLDSGPVQIRARLFELEAYTQVQFETALRPSLLTGVINLRVGADNTDYFSSYRDFLQPDADGETTVELDGAAFATGKVGDWLLTAAFNGDRPLNEACETCTNRLFRADQATEKPYPIYGDNSTVRNLTPSQDSLFFRLERSPKIPGAVDPDYIMWGDYGTAQEFATPSQEFSALSRQLSGAKLNYNFGNLQISALYSQGGEAYQRDTLQPDGTSGFYFLTQRLVVPGSEEVYFELEELERPGTIIQRDRLQRGQDYEIDYDRGSLVFTDPVLRTEVGDNGEVLVRRIIITYQNESSEDNRVYGGRLRYHLNRNPGQASWLGATYFREDQGARNLELYGVDAQIHLGENYKFIGEYAQSQNNSAELGEVSGSAYRFELDAKFADGFTGRAYYRRADTGFANQSTVSFVPGQTRYGIDLNAQLSPSTRLRFNYDHEKNEGVSIRPIVTLGDLINAGQEGIPDGLVDNELTTITAGLAQRFGQANLNVDLLFRDRLDYLNPENNGSSTQLRTTFNSPLSQSLKLRLTNQTTLSADADAVFSDRSQIGLDWQIAQGVTLNLNQNWYHSGTLAGQSTTNLSLNGEYKPWHNTILSARYDIENFSTGMQDAATFGLKHNWAIFKNLDLDFAYEKVVGNLFVGGDGTVGQGAARSIGVRGGDSLSIRGRYRGGGNGENFQAEAGYEFRNTNGSGTSNITASIRGKLSPSLTALANFDRRFAAGQATRGLPPTSNLRLGLAYRNPNSDKFNALIRYEYRKNPNTIPETLLIGQGNDVTEHLFAGEAIYAPHYRWEFYGKLGYRHSTLKLAEDFAATSAATLAQLRATYLLNRQFDLTGGIRWINQHTAGYSEMGWLAEVGYYATPNLRLAVGYSSGRVNNDRDFSGSRSDGGFYAGVTLKLDSLFDFGRQAAIAAVPETRQLMVQTPKPDANLQAALATPLRLDVSQAIDFERGKTSVSLEGQMVLDSLVTVLNQYTDLKLDIQGVLPPLAELTPDNLEARRLQTARQYLLSRGISGDRLTLRSLGKGSQNKATEQPITFTLSGTAATFQAISTQLGGNPLVSDLITAELPQLAALPPETPQNTTSPTTNRPLRDRPQGAATMPVDLSQAGFSPAVTNPQPSTYGSSDPALNPNFTYVPYWILGFAPSTDPDALLLAEMTPMDPITEFVTSFIPTLDPIAAIPTERLLSRRESPPIPQPEPQILGDRRLDETPEPELDNPPAATQILGDRRLGPDDADESIADSLPEEPQILGDRRLDESEADALITNSSTEPQILGDRRLGEGTPELLTFEPPSNFLSAREIRRLESALYFLLSDDLDRLGNLFQARSAQQTAVRGELVNLDWLMQNDPSPGGNVTYD